METWIIWLLTIILIAIIFIPYFIKFRRLQKQDKARKAEAERLGADKAIAQHPQIDQLACIGCGACVAACPEGDVLGVVMGKAAVINGLKCVGHGRCAEACPVEGITVGLGDIKMRDDLPALSEDGETNITDLYIAGELGGLALIKNAISQGRTVAEAIFHNIDPSDDGAVKDIAIVGAGPAGMSAALQAVKRNLSYVLIDQQDAGGTILQYPRKKLVMTKPVEIPLYGFLKKPEYSKEELLDIWTGLMDEYRINLKSGEKLSTIRKENGYFKVITSGGVHQARTVILALGRRGSPRKLGVLGEDRAKVMYKLIDAEMYNNEHLLIVGGGDSAIEAAIGLARQRGNTVTISYRKEKFFRIKSRNAERLQDMIDSGKVNTVFNSNVKRIDEKSVLLEVNGEEKELKNDYVFIFAGGEPPFKLLRDIGIAFGRTEVDKATTG